MYFNVWDCIVIFTFREMLFVRTVSTMLLKKRSIKLLLMPSCLHEEKRLQSGPQVAKV